VIFVDSNVPMYLVGATHPHKVECQQLLERYISEEERLVSDVEVLEEILHRYVAVDRRDAIGPAFEALLGVVDEVFPVELADVERAKGMVLAHVTVSARDALHVAVMERRGVTKIFSFDSGFDAITGITRVPG
jgi:uncharacterized protein